MTPSDHHYQDDGTVTKQHHKRQLSKSFSTRSYIRIPIETQVDKDVNLLSPNHKHSQLTKATPISQSYIKLPDIYHSGSLDSYRRHSQNHNDSNNEKKLTLHTHGDHRSSIHTSIGNHKTSLYPVTSPAPTTANRYISSPPLYTKTFHNTQFTSPSIIIQQMIDTIQKQYHQTNTIPPHPASSPYSSSSMNDTSIVNQCLGVLQVMSRLLVEEDLPLYHTLYECIRQMLVTDEYNTIVGIENQPPHENHVIKKTATHHSHLNDFTPLPTLHTATGLHTQSTCYTDIIQQLTHDIIELEGEIEKHKHSISAELVDIERLKEEYHQYEVMCTNLSFIHDITVRSNNNKLTEIGTLHNMLDDVKKQVVDLIAENYQYHHDLKHYDLCRSEDEEERIHHELLMECMDVNKGGEMIQMNIDCNVTSGTSTSLDETVQDDSETRSGAHHEQQKGNNHGNDYVVMNYEKKCMDAQQQLDRIRSIHNTYQQQLHAISNECDMYSQLSEILEQSYSISSPEGLSSHIHAYTQTHPLMINISEQKMCDDDIDRTMYCQLLYNEGTAETLDTTVLREYKHYDVNHGVYVRNIHLTHEHCISIVETIFVSKTLADQIARQTSSHTYPILQHLIEYIASFDDHHSSIEVYTYIINLLHTIHEYAVADTNCWYQLLYASINSYISESQMYHCIIMIHDMMTGLQMYSGQMISREKLRRVYQYHLTQWDDNDIDKLLNATVHICDIDMSSHNHDIEIHKLLHNNCERILSYTVKCQLQKYRAKGSHEHGHEVDAQLESNTTTNTSVAVTTTTPGNNDANDTHTHTPHDNENDTHADSDGHDNDTHADTVDTHREIESAVGLNSKEKHRKIELNEIYSTCGEN